MAIRIAQHRSRVTFLGEVNLDEFYPQVDLLWVKYSMSQYFL